MVRKIILWLLSDEASIEVTKANVEILKQAFKEASDRGDYYRDEAEKLKNWYRFAFRSGFEQGYALCELEMLHEAVDMGIEHRRSIRREREIVQ